MINIYAGIFITALIIAFVFTPAAIKIAPKIGAIDIPQDSRRAHTKPMPRFGGMAIYIGTISGLAIFLHNDPKVLGLIVAGTVMYIVGIIDDLRDMDAKVKFLCQIGCALILYFAGVNISFVRNPFVDGYIFFPWFISLFITVIWIVGITNTINLIDGLDGLAAGVSFIASVCIAYSAFISRQYTVAAAMLAIAGGALGFLPFNFHPAKIFMGDGGSLFLGFMMAGVSVLGSAKGATLIATIVPFLVLFIPIFDTAFAIIRRAASGRPIMEADKGHLHHRIMATGLGQRRTVLILYGISATMGVVAILVVKREIFEASILMLVAATFIYLIIEEHANAKIYQRKRARQTVMLINEGAEIAAHNERKKETAKQKEISNESNDGVRNKAGSDQDGPAGQKTE